MAKRRTQRAAAVGVTPGARTLSLADAVALVERVRASAVRGARESLEALAAAVPMPIAGIAIRACPELPPTIEEWIVHNRAQTMADSAMYRQSLATAAKARGWSVFWYDREGVFHDAAAALGREDLDTFLQAMGRSIGPPWRQTQACGSCGACGHRTARAAADRRMTRVRFAPTTKLLAGRSQHRAGDRPPDVDSGTLGSYLGNFRGCVAGPGNLERWLIV